MTKKSKDKLGIGLKALLAKPPSKAKEKTAKVTVDAGIAMVPISQIEANPFQPRTEFEKNALLELVQSIKSYGIIQPLTLRKLNADTYQIISGERRFRASKLAKLKEVPAYIREADDTAVLEMALVENIQREDLNALEVALTYQRLIDECEINHEALADKVGKKRSTVSNYVRLLKLPPFIQKALKEKELTMGHARALLSLESQEQLQHVSRQVIAQGLSVRATEVLVKSMKGESSTSSAKVKKVASNQSPIIQEYIELISIELGRKVSIKRDTNGKGKIVIPFESDNQLTDIIEYFES